MFLEQLKDPIEKDSFMKLAYSVATADGSMGLPEIKMLGMFEQEMGIQGWKLTDENSSVSQICSAFPNDLSRKITFSNLLAMGYSEEYENPGQARAIKKIREALAISPDSEQEYRDWMELIKGSYFPKYYID
jgi:hypothetical protein